MKNKIKEQEREFKKQYSEMESEMKAKLMDLEDTSDDKFLLQGRELR